MKAPAVALAVDSRCELGECILWCERHNALFWTDISGARLWMHRPDSGETRHWNVPAPLGCFAFCDDGRLLLGLAKGLYLADPIHCAGDVLPLSRIVDVEPQLDHTRINDGRCDRDGNFVFGTKSEGLAADGSFYQFSFRHGLRRLDLPRAAIPNSICFSHDGGTLYFCDSRAAEILCCSYDSPSAGVSDVRAFARIDAGSPDGSIIDADGCLWNAQWGAARVVRYLPDGSVGDSVALPVKNPSCCAFGGGSLDRLYVTTAREDMTDGELAAMPQAGGVYRIDLAGAKGLVENRVATA